MLAVFGDVASFPLATEDRQVALHREARNAAHEMHAELQAERVNLVGDGLEPCTFYSSMGSDSARAAVAPCSSIVGMGLVL